MWIIEGMKASELARDWDVSAGTVRHLCAWRLITGRRAGNSYEIQEVPDRKQTVQLLTRAMKAQARLIIEACQRLEREAEAVRLDAQSLRESLDAGERADLGDDIQRTLDIRSPLRDAVDNLLEPQMNLIAMHLLLA